MLKYEKISSKLVITGSRLLLLVNISWMLILLLYIVFLLVYVASGVSLPLLIITLACTTVISVADILGFILLGSGMITQYFVKKRLSAPLAGFFLLLWSAVAIFWRVFFVYSLVIYDTFTSDDKLEIYDGFQAIFYINCIILLFGLIFLVKIHESLPLLAYAIINVISSLLMGATFRMFTDVTIVFIGILLLIGTLFKLLVVPAIGSLAFSELIYNVLDPQNASYMAKKKTNLEKLRHLLLG